MVAAVKEKHLNQVCLWWGFGGVLCFGGCLWFFFLCDCSVVVILPVLPFPLLLGVCTLCFQTAVTILFIPWGKKWYWCNVNMPYLSKQGNGYPVYAQKGGEGKGH